MNYLMNSVHVTDMQGHPVLHVEPQVGKSHRHERRHFALIANDNAILAKIVATPVYGSVDEFELLQSDGATFGKLFQTGFPEELRDCPRHEPLVTWKVWTPAGTEWFFLRHVDSSAMEVRDNLGRILAMADQDKESEKRDQLGAADKAYWMQIAPLMDVTIALCGLLAVNHLL